jgi:hypothetical protein
MSLDPLTVIAVFELIEKSINVGSNLAGLIQRAKAGESIPMDEIKADKEELDGIVDEWDSACEGGKK